MKNLIAFFLFLVFPINLSAGIIVLANGDNIEDVSNITITNSDIKYIANGQEQSISIKNVAAIMHDDGRYEEITKTSQMSFAQPEYQSTYSVQNQQDYSNLSYTTPQEEYKGSLKQAKDIRTAGIVFTAVGALPIGLPMLLVGIHRVDNYH